MPQRTPVAPKVTRAAVFYCAAIAGVVTGLLGLLVNAVQAPTTEQLTVISGTAAVVALLGGLGLLAAARRWHKTRYLCGWLILLGSAYSLANSLGLFELLLATPWLSIDARHHWPVGLIYGLFGVTLLVTPRTRWRRRFWYWSGLLMLTVGAGTLLLLWWPGIFTWVSPHPVLSTVPVIFAMLFGLGLILGRLVHNGPLLMPARDSLLVCVAGVMITCALWFFLNTESMRTTEEQGDQTVQRLLQHRAELAETNKRLMERLVTRWNYATPERLATIQDIDLRTYLTDIEHLHSILYVDEQGDMVWEEHRVAEGAYHPLLAQEDVRLWLETAGSQPSYLFPLSSLEVGERPLVLLRLPVSPAGQPAGYLVSVFDLQTMLLPVEQTLASDFRTYARLGEHYFLNDRNLTFAFQDQSPKEHPLFFVTEHSFHIPYGPEIHVSAYLHNYRDLERASNLNSLIFVAGITFTVFLVVTLQHNRSLRRQRETAFYRARHDALTGLPNRARLEEELGRLLKHDDNIAVLFADLDGFKPINDSMGLDVGDELLVQVARRLEYAVQPGGFASHFGSDEFVLVQAGLTRAELKQQVQKILQCVAQPFDIRGYRLYVTASVGITMSEAGEPEQTPLKLVQQADMAMYEAKRHGRNYYAYYASVLDERIRHSVELRSELQQAIEEDRLELHYQPILNATSGAVVVVEALLRLRQKNGDLLSPGVFIPLAENTGQIIPMSDWVLRRAMQDMAELDPVGQLQVSVNLSAMQFARANFIDHMQQVLEEQQFPPERLVLELTESILLTETDQAIGQLKRLRELNMSVAIDDFGTGYSSLAYLRSLPVDKLKIDRSFTQEATGTAGCSTITSGIIKMAHELNLEVVAEGVETAEQHTYMKQAGCALLQGFYFARPMPLTELRTWLAGRS